MLTEAIVMFAKAEELTRLYIDRADCYEMIGESAKSVGDFLLALDAAENKSDIVHIKSMIALALIKKDDKEQGLFWAMSAVDQDVRNAEGHFTLGLICEYCDFLNLAVESLQKSLELRPDYWQAMRVLGSCLRQNGQIEESIDTLTRYVAINPVEPLGYYELAWSLHVCAFSETQLRRAKQCYESALQYNPNAELRAIIERKMLGIQSVLSGHPG